MYLKGLEKPGQTKSKIERKMGTEIYVIKTKNYKRSKMTWSMNWNKGLLYEHCLGGKSKQTFLRRKNPKANKHRKKWSTYFTIREIQIETTPRSHLTPVGWQLSRIQMIISEFVMHTSGVSFDLIIHALNIVCSTSVPSTTSSPPSLPLLLFLHSPGPLSIGF